MAQPPPQLMSQPPQIFGDAYHGMPMQHLPPELTAQMFGDPGALLDDANEAKRRRIARVSLPSLSPSPPSPRPAPSAPPRLSFLTQPLTILTYHRPVICAGRRRLSVTESYQRVCTALITRQNASSRRSRRRGTHLKGECFSPRYHRPDRGPCAPPATVAHSLPSSHSAKYIEGLENRLGRMESLLRLSGMPLFSHFSYEASPRHPVSARLLLSGASCINWH